MKQITYDPLWKIRDKISAELRKTLKSYYISTPLDHNDFFKRVQEASRDYMLFGNAFPQANMTFSLEETGESIWKKT